MAKKVTKEDLTPEAMQFLEFLAKVSVDWVFAESAREARLEKEPKGYHLEGSYTCAVCRGVAANQNSWYDKNGIKCMTCQAAIDNKIIPVRIIKNDKLYYTEWELDHCFNLTKKHINQWIKNKILFARVIPSLTKGTHHRVFLLSDNKGFLPPKDKVKSVTIKVEEDGKSEYLLGVAWHRVHKDPLAHLAGYGIGKYMVKIETIDNTQTKTEDENGNEGCHH